MFCAAAMAAGVLLAAGMPPYAEWRAKVRPGHPRIYFNADLWPSIATAAHGVAKPDLERLLKRCDAYPEKPVCTGMEVLTSGDAGVHDPVNTPIPDICDWGDEAAECALAWRFTGERRYLDKVIAMLLANVDGFNAAFAHRRAVSWYAHSRINSMCAYDWVYEGLTEEERRRIIFPLLRSVDQFTNPVGRPKILRHNPTVYRISSYGEESTDIYAGLAAAGDGIADELAEAMMERGYARYKKVADRDWDEVSERVMGSSTPGYTLGDSLAFNFLQMNLAAIGENWAAHFPGWSYMPEWLWWMWIPDPLHPTIPMYAGFGDHRHNINDMPDGSLRLLLKQVTHFYRELDPNRARLAASLLPLVKQGPLDSDGTQPLTPFLLASDTPLKTCSAEKLRTAKAKARRFERYGQIFMRSGWEADSTYAFLSAGCDGNGLHKHYDEGSFVIYKHDFLALDSGSRAAQTDYNLHYYYSQSVAHNVTLVMKPGEKLPSYWGVRLENEDGVFNHGGMSKCASKILDYATCADYTKTTVDLTDAYGGKCRENIRQFVHLQPDYFVVYDRIEAEDASWEKKWLLHAQNEPIAHGRTYRADSRGGRLFCEVLLPADAAFDKVGGPGKEFWASGRNWPLDEGWRKWSESHCRRFGRGPYWGEWRMETRPGAPRRRDCFLHVLTACDTNCAEAVRAELVQTGTEDGVRVWLPDGRKAMVLFRRDGAAQTVVTFEPETDDELHVRLAKLCPPRPETAARFEGESAYPAPAKPYRQCAADVYAYMTSLPALNILLETGEIDNHYQHNAYPSKTHAALINAMLDYTRIAHEKRDLALRHARASAEYIVKQLEPAGAPLAFWPPTYIREPLKYDPKTDGPAKGPEMVGNEPAGAVKYRGQVMLVYPAEVGLALARFGKETGERAWTGYAEKIAATYLKVRRGDGSWPLKLNLATGEVVCANPLVSLRPLELFESLAEQTGEMRWRDAAEAAFAWIERHPLNDWNWDGQFEDILPEKPYTNPTKHNAIDTMMYLIRRFPGDERRLAQARNLIRFCEERFVCWKRPESRPNWEAPSVLEQYSCFCPIDASASKMICGYVALYRATGDAEFLAKAKVLANTMTRLQKPSGRIPTFWTGDWAADERYDWHNCMASSARALLELAEVQDRKFHGSKVAGIFDKGKSTK